MRYSLARDLNLYAVSWMENVAVALRTDRRLLPTEPLLGAGISPSIDWTSISGEPPL
jgi:hypothetical protein